MHYFNVMEICEHWLIVANLTSKDGCISDNNHHREYRFLCPVLAFLQRDEGHCRIRYRYTSFRKVSNELERVLQKSGSTFTREQTLIPSSPMDMPEDQQIDVFRRLIEIFENTPNVGEIRALTRNFQ